MISWTQELCDKAKRLFESGMSYSEIVQFIPGSTKGSIAGKIARMGIKREGGQRVKGVRFKRIKEVIPEPISNPSQLMELNHLMCHYPHGDPKLPGFYFCGAETSNYPYCPTHTKMCKRSRLETHQPKSLEMRTVSSGISRSR